MVVVAVVAVVVFAGVIVLCLDVCFLKDSALRRTCVEGGRVKRCGFPSPLIIWPGGASKVKNIKSKSARNPIKKNKPQASRGQR